MAAISNTELSDTFNTWRIRSNQLVSRINQFAVDESTIYANTIVANTSFTAPATSVVSIGSLNNLKVLAGDGAHANAILTLATTANGELKFARQIKSNQLPDELALAANVTQSANMNVFGKILIETSGRLVTKAGSLRFQGASAGLAPGSTGNVLKLANAQLGTVEFGSPEIEEASFENATIARNLFVQSNVVFTQPSLAHVRGNYIRVSANTSFRGANNLFTGDITTFSGNVHMLSSNVHIQDAGALNFPTHSFVLQRDSGGTGKEATVSFGRLGVSQNVDVDNLITKVYDESGTRLW